jgi:CO dehydrogenase maturation factor
LPEKLVLAVSGKGGAGKTTILTLILKTLIDHGKKNILVVDADPNTNLPETLGIKIKKTVGMIASDLKKSIERDSISPSMTKKDILEYNIFQTLAETDKFDLLAMGRTEGEGCYCTVNNLLTQILDTLSKNYDITLMDMEAGLEHLSRRTDRDVDIMVIVTDPSHMGMQTALRIKELAKEVHIKFKAMYMVANQFSPEMENIARDHSAKIGIEFGGIIPNDPNVQQYSLIGKSLLELPPNSPSLLAVENFLRKIGLIN